MSQPDNKKSQFIYEILLPLKFNQTFSYKSPDIILKIGDIVKVEFGRKKLFGLVLKKSSFQEFLNNTTLSEDKIKNIIEKNEFIHLKDNIIKFIKKISEYNLVPAGLVLKAFIGFLNSDKVKNDLIEKTINNFNQKFDENKLKLNELNESQQEIVNKISENFEKDKNIALIDGVTGSGKTEVYFKIIAQFLQKSEKQILIMLPEIALTSQIVSRFENVFGFKPALWHSKISKKEKREIFYGIINNKIKILIGARSSLLLPFSDLGLIVIDEEHDNSYKQNEGFNFNARDMAIFKSSFDKSKVILCSATPSLESYHNAKTGKYQYFSLSQKFNDKINEVKIIDLKRHKPEKNRHISKILRDEIANNFANNHQTLLFLNRRGYSPVMLCSKCGAKVECRDCSATIVYHKSLNISTCHYCGYEENYNKDCRECGSKDSIINFGVGVEKLQEEVKEFLPQARIALITSDNLTNFKTSNKIIQEISNNEVDIIIGTQMISKGYDFENLTLVGVVDADSGFYSDDLRASEKSYQLLSQVVGRAGRKKHQGKIFIQTYNADNFILKKLISQDKEGFYKFELNNRKILDLPPFFKLANIIIDSLRKNSALQIAKNIVRNFPFNENIEVLGPSKSKLFRHKNRYYYSVFIKANKKINLQKLISDVINKLDIKNEANIKVDIDP